MAHDMRVVMLLFTSCVNLLTEKAVVTWAENTEWRSSADGFGTLNKLKEYWYDNEELRIEKLRNGNQTVSSRPALS